MTFTIQNAYTKDTYTSVQTLSEARTFCAQHLLRITGDRTKFLSDLAAQVINVYDARATNYINPGF